MEELKAKFVVEKETKNTVRFQEVESDSAPILGTLYIQKWALRKLGNGTPKMIEVTIKAVGES